MDNHNKIQTHFPKHGWIGFLLILTCWPLNWMLTGLRTHLLFFPLWLGYILVVDALVYFRTGKSTLKNNPTMFILMFLLSAPTWWIFEFFNWRTENWIYMGRELFSDFEYVFYASLNFSIVIPAVFSTALLVRSFKWIDRSKRSQRKSPGKAKISLYILMGLTMLVLLLMWPTFLYPFLWISLFFVIDPINIILKKKSILAQRAEGKRSIVVSLFIGTLICGFFWEMWNFYSYPKWIYSTPMVNYWHIFEMPLFGYLGYLPFGLELYALYHLVMPKKYELTI